jgi:hypothetical protein
VCKASFFIKHVSGAQTGTLTAMIRQNDGTLVASSTTFLDASTLTSSYVEHTFDFPATTISADDMIMLNSESLTGTTAIKAAVDYGTDITLAQCWNENSSVYAQITPCNVKMTVTYACSPLASDTVGAVDFYLQVVD